MAHIELRQRNRRGARQIVINGIDFSMEIFDEGVELVEVGEGEFAEAGFRVTFVVSRLDLDNDADVTITDQLRPVAQRVRSIVAAQA